MSIPTWENQCFGWESVRGIELAPTIVYRGTVSPSGAHVRVTQPCFTWWCIHQGEVLVKTDEETVSVQPGQWILIPPGLRRMQHFRADSKIISINFFARWSQGLPLIHMRSLLVSDAETVPDLEALANQVCETSRADQWPHPYPLRDRKLSLADALGLESALNRFVSVLFGYAINCGAHLQSFAVPDGRLEFVLKAIRSELQGGPLPYKQWGQKSGLTRSQLDRLSRTNLRMSLREYRDHLLIAEACRLLASQETVKQTSAKLGFVDSAHFCRWLRRHLGRTPLSVRNGPVPL